MKCKCTLGSMDGAVVTSLASHQCGPGSVEFVVGSRLAPRVFLRVLLFSSLHKKTTSPNSKSTRIGDPHENQLGLMWLIESLGGKRALIST